MIFRNERRTRPTGAAAPANPRPDPRSDPRSEHGTARGPLTADPRPTAGPRMTIQGRTAEALDSGRARLIVTGVLLALAFTGVGYRLIDVMAMTPPGEPTVASAAPAAAPAVTRGEILDRNGTLLATTLPTASLYADPARVIDPVEAADELTAVLPSLAYAELLADLTSDSRFVWLERGLTPRQQFEINRLGIPGLGFQTEDRRFYPFGALTAHLVGYTNVDGAGIAGMEQALDPVLTGGEGTVRLSIDVRLQTILQEELQRNIDRHSAIGGAGLVMDVDTGEILAMVSLPSFNPVDPAAMPEEALFNRATLGVYEMGSTFKVFNTAAALEAGVTTLDELQDARSPIRVAGFTIDDFRGQYRMLTTAEVFSHSSNIGSVRLAQELGGERQRAFLDRLGLLQPAGLELPEVGRPLVPDPWRPINTMTISFGHGLSVSPVNLATGIAAMVNGGVLYEPTLLARDPGDTTLTGTRVISEATSDSIRRLMRLVEVDSASRDGSGDAYLIGGKTGTAEKTTGRVYSDDARLSSYVAAFPMTDPQYVVFAMIDEPQGLPETFGYATGGWVAAPVVRRVVDRIAPTLGVDPVDPNDPEIVNALWVEIPGREPPPQTHLATFRN